MAVTTTQQCYTDEWRRTDPDLVVHIPAEPPRDPEAADHVLVDYTPGGDLLAVWTMATKPDRSDFNVVTARSTDGGVNWTRPEPVHPPGPKPGRVSQFGFPVISRNGRIYVFYNRTTGTGRPSAANLRCRYSDDDGYTWTEGGVEIPYRRTRFDHPDPGIAATCIVWQKPTRDAKDRPIVPFTRTTHPYVLTEVNADHMGGYVDMGECRCEFLRFDNIDDNPDPKDVKLTWLPDDADELISVPYSFEPHKSLGYTFCQEPGLVLLPDGRLFTEMRTANGNIWYTVSDDDGHTWRPTEVLRYRDGGDPVLNPIAPSPMFSLEDGRYILFLQNHDGFGYGGRGPLDLNSRRPQFLAVGEYRPDAHQPVWFSEPLFLFDTQKIGVFPLNFMWLSMYASFTEREGRRVFWYTDRKIFVLGRYITDEMLAGLTVPS